MPDRQPTTSVDWCHASNLYVEACCHKRIINLMASLPSLFPIPWGSWGLCDSSTEASDSDIFCLCYLLPAQSGTSGLSEVWTKSWLSRPHFGGQVLEPFLNPSFVSPQCEGLLISLLCRNWLYSHLGGLSSCRLEACYFSPCYWVFLSILLSLAHRDPRLVFVLFRFSWASI